MKTKFQSQAEETRSINAARPKKLRRVFDLIVWLAAVGAAHGQQLLFHDDFNSLSNWIPFGDPLPLLLSSYQERQGVFDNNGDPNWPSGVISKQQFDLSRGYVIESEVYLAFTDPAGCWANPAIGIANPEYREVGRYYDALMYLELYANGDACWHEPFGRGHTLMTNCFHRTHPNPPNSTGY